MQSLGWILNGIWATTNRMKSLWWMMNGISSIENRMQSLRWILNGIWSTRNQKERAPKSRLAKTREKKRKMKVPYKIGLDKCSMVFWRILLPVVTSYYIAFFRVFLGI